MQEIKCNINGTGIFYRKKGNGRMIVFIHGFGETGDVWIDFVNLLPENYNIIIPDLPGSGRSELLNGNQIEIEDYARMINAIIQREITLGLNEKVILVGHSMGGYIALSYLKIFPASVLKLVLFHSSVFADPPEKIITRRKAIEFIKQKGAPVFLKASIPDLFSKTSQNNHKNIINELILKGNKFSNQALIQYYQAMITRKDSTFILKQTPIPILFIIGEEDTAVPLEISLKQSHLPLVSFIKILKNVGHMGMLEEPELTCKAIIHFLQP